MSDSFLGESVRPISICRCKDTRFAVVFQSAFPHRRSKRKVPKPRLWCQINQTILVPSTREPQFVLEGHYLSGSSTGEAILVLGGNSERSDRACRPAPPLPPREGVWGWGNVSAVLPRYIREKPAELAGFSSIVDYCEKLSNLMEDICALNRYERGFETAQQ